VPLVHGALAPPSPPSHRPQRLLEDTANGGDGKGFFQAPHTTLVQETLGLRGQRIPGKEDNTLAEVRLLLRQYSVEPWAVELWHPHVTQEQVISALLELGQGQPPVGREIHRMAVAAQQPSSTRSMV
jgi:hypothetical protein